MAEPGPASPTSPPPPVNDQATSSEVTQSTASENTADTVDSLLPATTGAVQLPVPFSTTTVNPVADPVQHATRDPTRDSRFLPGAGQAFFSTELGIRAPRPVSQVSIPPIARGRNDPATVVCAARYWQDKYPRECLCILPTQGWTVEDLWDAEDLHVEDREFCEQMLAFISQETYRVALQYAHTWVHEHSDRVEFTDLRMGSVYNVNDPLDIIDQIFIFGEPNQYPRVFLWHVAHIMIVDWIESCKARATPVATGQMQPSSTMGSHHVREGIRISSTEVNPSDGKKRTGTRKNNKRTRPRSKTLTALTESAPTVKSPKGIPIVAPTAPNQPHMYTSSHRVSSHGHLHPGTLYMPPRNVNIGAVAGPSMLSPNMPVPAAGMRRSNRGAASASWAENNNRMYPAPIQRQPFPQAPYMAPQFAIGQMVPGMMAPFVPAPQVGLYPHPQMVNPQHDPTMNARGPMSFPSGVMHNPSVGPAIVHHNTGPHNSSMGDMTNIHYQNQMGSPFADPRAPMPPRPNNPPMPQLYDPYSGNNRKFSGVPAYNNMGKKGGPGNFTAQTSRGRKTSNPAGRASQHNSNVDLHPNSPRYQDFGARYRQSEEDPNIVSDTVSGCGHTWIGIQNSTVNELWVGDLPADTSQGEIEQMFKQNVKITPTKVVIKTNGFNKAPSHAFVTFASYSDAKTALTINQFNPRLSNGVRPIVSVPRRFYHKGFSPSPGQSEQLDSQNTSGVPRLAPTEEKGKQADNGVTIAKGKVSYSPQDVRSGLPKKPVVDPESGEPAETTANPGLDRTKRQQKSPTKNSKAKSKRESPVKDTIPEKVVKKTDGKSNTGFHSMVATSGADNTKDSQANKKANLKVDKPKGSATTSAAVSSKEKVAPMAILAPDTNAVQGKAPAGDIPSQSPKHQEAAAIIPSQGKVLVISDDESSSIDKKTTVMAPLPQATDTTLLATPGVDSGEHLKNVDTKVPNAAVKVPSPESADENNSDDEAKNDVSFHSAPEVQSDAGQPDPQPEVPNESLEANQDTPVLPNIADEGKPNASETQRSAPATTTSRGATTDDITPTQDAAATSTTSTAIDSTMAVETASTTTKVSAMEASKKSGVSQVQSLHPFAKSKSQSKKEKEAKKKHQKKEADRIAKAKAEKGKQTSVDADAQAKTELPIDSGTLPIAPDDASEPEAAEIGTQKSPNNTKAKGKDETKTAEAVSAGRIKKHNDENETGKPDGNTASQASSVTREVGKINPPAVKQVSLTGSGVHGLPETTRLPVLPHPADTPKASAKNPSAKEVTNSRQTPSAAPIHIASPHEHLSRRSSTATLVGEDGTALPTSPTNPSHNLSTGTGITESKAPDEAPKKKKKPKKKKTKTAVEPAPSVTNPPGSTSSVHNPTNLNGEDFFEYDPFTSQMTHIDAIRNAVEHDKTSYFARTNASMQAEKEAEEQGKAQESSQSDDGD
ncbi:RRM-1 multi-domain protein [Pyrenophora tritici-repentis]|nr:RRM-1 multi-domain protein [Pyrenophora tritici-repentis]KAI0610715.1 RRM-1 multi-domain protein [Pyrenophora tritici-repentis]